MTFSLLHPGLAWGLLAALLPLAVHLFFRRRPRPTPFPAIELVLRARRQTERRLRLRKVALFTARTLLLAAVAAALARPRLLHPAAVAAAERGPGAVAIVLDASGSMRYRLGGATLFERAQKDALSALGALRSDEPATAVVCSGATPPAVVAPGFDRQSVRRALAEAHPSAGWADLTGCAAAGARALSEGAAAGLPSKRLVVATDLAASAWRLEAAPPVVPDAAGGVRPEVTVLDAARGAPLPNRAVAGLAAQPDPAAGPRGYRLALTLASHGGTRAASGGKGPTEGGGEAARPSGGSGADVEVQLRAGTRDAPVALRSYTALPEGGVSRKVLGWSFAQGGPSPVWAALIPGDALDLDDERVAVVEVPREVRALVVNGAPSSVRHRDEAYFVEAALASPASPVRATVIDPGGLATARLDDFDVVLLLGVRSPGARSAELRAFVERGGGLLIAMGDEVDPERYDAELGMLLPRPLHVLKSAGGPREAPPEGAQGQGREVPSGERGAPGSVPRGERARQEDEAARFADIDWAHPALEVFTGEGREGLLGARTWRYMLLDPSGGKGEERVLFSFDDGSPALVEARRGRGKVMLFTSTLDRSWSDWAIRTSFLPALQRLTAYLAGGLDERSAEPATVQQARTLKLGPGQRALSALGPDGRERPLAAPAGGGPPAVVPDAPGLWQVRVEDDRGVRLDPGLAFAAWPNPRESDTARLAPGELTAWFGGDALARVATGGAGGERQFPLWSGLLALGLLAFLAESALLRR